MGKHLELRMKKVLQSTISSAEFISIPTNNKFDKAVRIINDNKSWERCYVLIKIISLVLEFFTWHIVIMQERKTFITIKE